MVEMVIRSVEQCPRSDQAVVILEARAAAIYPRLVLTVMAEDAHAVDHALGARETLCGRVFALLTRILTGLRGKLSAVELVPAGERMATAWLWLECPGGRTRVPIEVGHALSFAVRLGIPLRASRALLAMHAVDTAAPERDQRIDVPSPFRRAFGA